MNTTSYAVIEPLGETTFEVLEVTAGREHEIAASVGASLVAVFPLRETADQYTYAARAQLQRSLAA